MLALRPAARLASTQLDELLLQLRRMNDGSEETIHQARVAIRRFFEELSLLERRSDEDELEKARRRLSRAARALSRVRDADVGHRLVENMAARFPAPSIVLLRLRGLMAQARERSRRRAIKTIERINLDALRESALRGRRRGLPDSRGAWRTALQHHLASRAEDVRSALERSGNVYFPNRLHTARIAIKRLRYAFELADRIGGWRPRRALGLLKKAQEALGQAHDREVLLRQLDTLRSEQNEDHGGDLEPLRHFVRAEIRDFHERYVGLRPEILAVCDACRMPASFPGRAWRAVLAAGVLVPTIAVIRRRTREAAAARPRTATAHAEKTRATTASTAHRSVHSHA